MEPSFNLEPSTKKKRADIFDIDMCIFGFKPLSSNNLASMADPSKIESLFRACQERHDDTRDHTVLRCKELTIVLVQPSSHFTPI